MYWSSMSYMLQLTDFDVSSMFWGTYILAEISLAHLIECWILISLEIPWFNPCLG